MAQIINGKEIAQTIKDEMRLEVEELKKIGKSWLVMEEAFKDYFKFQQNTNI